MQLFIFLDIGLNFTQISIIMAVSALTSVFFEIPTGAIADIFGRRASVFLSYFFLGIIYLLMPLSSNYIYLLVLFLILGMTQTLSTGAYEAWVVSNLKRKKKSKLIANYFAHDLSIMNIGIVIAPLIAAFIAVKINMAFLWYIQGIMTIVSGFYFTNFKRAFQS